MKLAPIVLLAVACWATPLAAGRSLLIDPAELKREIARAPVKIRIVDLRDSEEEYRKGHIPGAVHIRIRQLDNLEANRQGMPVTLDQARNVFAALGLDSRTVVVGYDDASNRFAARLLYFLEFFGHKNVRVLDGGLPRWLKEGGTLEGGEVKAPPGRAVPQPRARSLATADWISGRLGKNQIQVLDARSPDEYAGRQKTRGRPGHIPGAIPFDWRETLTPEGRFKSVQELRALIESKGLTRNRECVTYCASGVRAAHLYMVLRLAGYKKVRNYDGSWEEWGTDERRPVEQ